MTRALEILLKGKVFDGGAISYFSDRRTQNSMIELARRCSMKTPADRTFVLDRLAQLAEGCIASSDQPGCYFLEELLELSPNAKVIVTTRDKESWWASYSQLWQSIHDLYPWSWLQPQLHRFCVFSFEFWRRVPEAVGLSERPAWPMSNQEGLFEAHAAYVKRVVPAEQLFYFDVKSGWAPLCQILDLPVPDEEFPHAFPRSWLVQGRAKSLAQLKKRFAILLGAGGLVLGLLGYAGQAYLPVWLKRVLKK